MNTGPGHPPKTLTVAIMPGVTVTKWARRWDERQPDVRLSIVRTDADEQVQVLHDGLAELSFVRLPVEKDGLHLIPLYREAPVVVLEKDHPLAEAETLDISQLDGLTVLSDPDSDMELVAAGVGILVIPQSVARLYNRKDVVAVPVTGVEETEIGLAWLVENTDPVIEEFIGVVRGRTIRSSRAVAEEPTEAKKPVAKKPRPEAAGSKKAPIRGIRVRRPRAGSKKPRRR